MSRLTNRISLLESQIADLQSKLEDARDKQYKRSAKRRLKAWRKKMAKDAMFFATARMLMRLERDMFGACFKPPKFTGILQQLI